MKALRLLLPLLIPSSFANEAWLESALKERESPLAEMESIKGHVDKDLEAMGIQADAGKGNADDSMPESPDGDMVAVADGGVVFDSNHSRLVYLGNVRVNHPQVQLKCQDRLYIQLPRETMKSGLDQAQKEIAPQADADKAATSAKGPQEHRPHRAEAKEPPLCIQSGSAVTDAQSNRIYIIGAPGIEFQWGKRRARLGPAQSGQPAKLLADSNGDIFIAAGEAMLQWADEKGQSYSLRHNGGDIYYRAETRTLLFLGNTNIQTPHGSLSCSNALSLVLRLKEREGGNQGEFMGQFAGLAIEGIEQGAASGSVLVSRLADAERHLAASVTGETLVYNGITGECRIVGGEPSLAYGQNSLATDGSICLAPNGDITVLGNAISGAYARPAAKDGEPPIIGQFRTRESIRYTAADAAIRMQGVEANDPLSSFHCGGSLELVMLTEAGSRVPAREKAGMLNLSIMACRDIAQAHAKGGVRLEYAEADGSKGLALAAATADINAQTGEATLASPEGGSATARYKEYELTAESDHGSPSLHLAANGDIRMQGELVTAVIPTHNGLATAKCANRLELFRESGQLELGRDARMESAEGILQAHGPLLLTLAKGEPGAAKSPVRQFPQLSYNFTRLRQADTQEGGTLQTSQASLQCTGPIHVEMAQAPGAGKTPEEGIRLAMAEGNVAIAGKDASGRTLAATGDKLTIDGATGQKRLTGRRVTLQDADNTHIASGGGASIVIDKNNNARISGAVQSTSATRIHNQIERQKQKKD